MMDVPAVPVGVSVRQLLLRPRRAQATSKGAGMTPGDQLHMCVSAEEGDYLRLVTLRTWARDEKAAGLWVPAQHLTHRECMDVIEAAMSEAFPPSLF